MLWTQPERKQHMSAIAYHRAVSGKSVAEFCGREGLVTAPSDILGLIMHGFETRPDWIAIHASAIAPAFFDLRSGFAGEMLQKIVNYRAHVAILGDIAVHVQKSEALAALVREMNRGADVVFAPTMEAFLKGR